MYEVCSVERSVEYWSRTIRISFLLLRLRMNRYERRGKKNTGIQSVRALVPVRVRILARMLFDTQHHAWNTNVANALDLFTVGGAGLCIVSVYTFIRRVNVNRNMLWGMKLNEWSEWCNENDLDPNGFDFMSQSNFNVQERFDLKVSILISSLLGKKFLVIFIAKHIHLCRTYVSS